MSQTTKTTTLLVIGGGPGGYVAAIRAGQLGVPTLLVEGERLGGTCLNIGCIPSKALIHAAEEFEKARHYADGSALGISVSSPSIDIARTVAWKDGIVGKLTGGVAALLKKNGVEVVQGWASLLDGKTAEVETAAGRVRIQCEHLLLAAGSEPTPLPSMPFGGMVVSSTEALSPADIPKKLVVVGGGTSAWNWAPCTASWARKWPWSKPRTASCRPTTPNSPSPWRPPCPRWASSCTWAARCWG